MTKETLKNANLGDKTEYEYQTELYGYDTLPDDLRRSDIEEQITGVDAELKTGEHGVQYVEITVNGEAMKVLARNWDYTREPITDKGKRNQRNRTWLRRGMQAVGVVLPFGISLAVMSKFNAVFGSMTVNGEPVEAPGLWDIVALMLIFALLFIVIVWGVRGGLPRQNGGRA